MTSSYLAAFSHFKSKTFRQKFFTSYVLLLLFFLALLFPLVAKSVQHIIYASMNNRMETLIKKLEAAPSEIALIKLLKKQKHYEFFRLGLLDDKMRLLYDSHTRHLREPFFFPLQYSSQPEMQQAAASGTGYSEEYSQVLEQKMIYLARRFDFNGKPYFLRLAFPYQYTQDLRNSFEMGFIILSSCILLLFSAMSAFVLYKMTRPIKQIIQAIQPYHKEKTALIEPIALDKNCHEEFTLLASTINSLSMRIQKQLEALKEFTANASHELKTPITIIKGFAELLAENPALTSEMIHNVTHRITTNCTRMTNTVQNLLALSNIEHLAKAQLQSCYLPDLLNHCRQRTLELYPEATIEIHFDERDHFSLLVDPDLLEVAFSNILDNGCKYGPESAHICISLKQTPKYCTIEFADNGSGIAPKDLPHIFDRFYRVAGTSHKKGSGLGLCIVQTIAEKHSGKVTVTSELGKGSRFTVLLLRT